MYDIELSKALFPTVKEQNKFIDTANENDEYYTRKGDEVLQEAHNAWSALSNFRELAERNKKFTFGDQLSDKVQVGRRTISEKDYIKMQGNTPLQNNRIRGIVRSVSGLMLNSATEPVCIARERGKQQEGEIMSATLQYVYQNNKLKQLDVNAFNYFLVCGMPIYKSVYSRRNGKEDVWTDIIQPRNFFFDLNARDPRMWDCHLVGEIHDLGLYDVMDKFSNGNKEKALWIKTLYGNCRNENYLISRSKAILGDEPGDIDFFMPIDHSRCRVIEAWRKESKERLWVHDTFTGGVAKYEIGDKDYLDQENNRRIQEWSAQGIAPEDMKLIDYEWFIDNYWYYYYLTPTGEILSEGETPYWHESHPYSFTIYPYYDGEVHAFVSDFIDQQKYINRLIMMQDFLMRASAKGVLMIPEDSIPEGYTADNIAEQWVKFNGVIVYKAKAGVQPPQQVSAATSQLGVYDMLSMQMKLLEDISGVQGAMQGQAAKSGTPSSLYMQQVQNATTSLTELLDAFKAVREDRDKKNMQLIQQFYNEPRYITPLGNHNNAVIYEPEQVKNIEFDLSLTESTNTPAYRLIMNDFLMQLFQAGAINVKDILENGAFPFADKLLQSIQTREQEMMQAAQGQIPQGQVAGAQIASPEVQAMIDQQAQIPQLNPQNNANPTIE